NCPAFATFDTCKHIAGVLLAITQDNGSKRKRFAIDRKMTDRTDQTTDLFAKQLLYTFRNEKETVTSPEMLQTAYVLSLTKTNKMAQYALSIELKIGKNRPYIIRDIRGFLKAFHKENSFKLNQSFTFNPNMHYFSSKDQAFIDLIQQCYDQER